ncbi:MAG: ion channel protein Tsx [Rickettsiales bacterium]|nr:ion channel protein Tsx [Rickettsiales bacterium]
MKFFYILIILTVIILAPSSLKAEDFIEWQTTNIQLLRGHDYQLGDKYRTITTLEHANKWRYGDFYGFIDLTLPETDKSTYYTELSPRLSLSRVLNKDLSFGPVKDILIATTFEKAKNFGPQYLYGLGFDLDIPTFTFATLNFYIHENTQKPDTTWQTTFAWKKPLNLFEENFVIEGFADFQGREGASQANQLIVPRFLWNASDTFNIKENKLFIGIEYQYWHNKFGVDGVTESVPQLQMKLVF